MFCLAIIALNGYGGVRYRTIRFSRGSLLRIRGWPAQVLGVVMMVMGIAGFVFLAYYA
jgi:hypothetical protein